MSLARYERSQKRTAATAAASAWQPCFVDPWRGLAHFDGITIEADPITSARPDRVLPCIADEQVLFCRMLKQTLVKTKGRKALDFGTGSGVLGIAGAAMGLDVTGIDINPRAIAFANFNKRQNTSLISRRKGNFEPKVSDGLLGLDLQDGSLDYIFVNPPFAPVPDDLATPNSVAAGEDGQRFLGRTFLERAHHLLKPGGDLLIIHLLLVDQNNRPTRLLEEMSTQSWSHLKMFWAGNPMPLREFRRCVWGSSGPGPSKSRLRVTFLQLTKQTAKTDNPAVRTIVASQKCPASAVPPTTWEDRLKVHKAVLDGSPRRAYGRLGAPARALVPAGEFYLERLSPLLKEKSAPNALRTPIVGALNKWIAANRVLSTPFKAALEGEFDVLMIEAAPWYLDGIDSLRLNSTTSLICGLASHLDPGKRGEQCSMALRQILAQIREINDSGRSVFRHRDQVGSHSGQWHAAIAWNQEVDLATIQSMNVTCNDSLPSWDVEDGVGVATLTVRLGALDIGTKNPSTVPFDECLRRALEDFTAILVANGLVTGKKVNCYVAALPLPPAIADTGSGRDSEDASKLAGFLYVYGWSCRPWSPTAEATLADVARVAALMHEEGYASAAEQELRVSWQRDTLRFAKHELDYVVKEIHEDLTADAKKEFQSYLGTFLLIDSKRCRDFLEAMRETPLKALTDVSPLTVIEGEAWLG